MKTSKLGRGFVGSAVLVGLMAMIGIGTVGCNKTQKKADLAQQESAELRERMASLEQQVRDKDSRIAELESNRNQVQQPIGYQPPSNWNGNTGGNTGGDSGVFSQDGSGRLSAEIKGDVLFSSGSVSIRPEARKELDTIASELKRKYGSASIRVEGHTDSDPIKKSKWGSNEQLSQARADAVREYLVKKGIGSGRVEAVGYGSSRPKGTKAASRRVDVVIMN